MKFATIYFVLFTFYAITCVVLLKAIDVETMAKTTNVKITCFQVSGNNSLKYKNECKPVDNSF